MTSIIIPIYNQAKKLSNCLDSIKKQSYNNYEIIVVNDGSTDNIYEVIKKWQKEFGIKFKFVENEINRGAPVARNRGFRKSRGEFILFCDADAVLYPEALETMLKSLKEHPEASYVYPGHKFGWKTFRSFAFDAEKLKQMPYIHTMSLIRREHFPGSGWDESIKKLQDWDLWLRMLAEGHKGYWIDQVLFKVSPGGTMSSWLPSFFYKLFPLSSNRQEYHTIR